MYLFSQMSWFRELVDYSFNYFNRMDQTQWGIVSACIVLLGFLCLKGNLTNRAL
jgi:hypothetical protein